MIRVNRNILKELFAALLFIFVISEASYAQFIDLQLDIDSKLTASTQQALSFGTLTSNSGHKAIDLGSLNMGIFSITALENQLLLVTLDKPKKLRHENPDVKATIPLNLYSRYGYSSQNYRDSYPLPQATSTIKVATNPEPGPWNTIYIFMYGAIDIGNIPDGVYSNNIVLDVEYL